MTYVLIAIMFSSPLNPTPVRLEVETGIVGWAECLERGQQVEWAAVPELYYSVTTYCVPADKWELR